MVMLFLIHSLKNEPLKNSQVTTENSRKNDRNDYKNDRNDRKNDWK